MAKKDNGLFNALVKYGNDVCRKTTHNIADELTKTASFAIEDFYEDYPPHVYQRHYYNFEKKSFKRYYEHSHGKKFYGGVELTPERMDDIYEGTVSQVFSSVYNGFHGIPYEKGSSDDIEDKRKIKRMSPTPYEIILDKQYEIVLDINKYLKQAQDEIPGFGG